MLWCLLLIAGAYLAVPCSLVFCSDQQAEGPASGRSPAQDPAGTGFAKRPPTVADSIQMTRLGDVSYTEGGLSNGRTAKFSPDGKHFVVVLKKGNLQANTNEYSLVLFQTAEVFQSPAPRDLVSLASSSNRPAIDSVHWLEDNGTILFLGELPGEPTQLYSVKCSSGELKKLTSSPTYLTSFVTTASGEEIVYSAKNPAATLLTETASRNGIIVTNQEVTDLIRGSQGGQEYDDDSLFVRRLGEDLATKLAIQGRIGIGPPEMALSPDGKYLLIESEATHVPSTWREYEDPSLKQLAYLNEDHTYVLQYELVDTVTGVSQALVDAPIPVFAGSEMAWSPDSKSVVVSNVYLPLDISDPAERARRKGHTFLVEFKVPGREFVKISEDENLRLRNWDPKTGSVVCDVGRDDSLSGKTTPHAYFRKSGATWAKANGPEQTAAPALPDIFLDEGMNTPPRVVAVDSSTGRKSQVMDLNPQFQNLALARVEEITWKDSRGHEAKGGLYWPPDYVAGKKYPLVMQTHDWRATKFWMDGPWPTAFAAQPLAGKGFFVLQVGYPDRNVVYTSKEAPRAMAIYESGIDYLDRRGLIDPNRVGITGFSRTFYHVTYTLTHSKHHFAAAALADGVDFGYFQYMTFQATADDFEKAFGGPPYGKIMFRWLKESPAFLMDKIQTPLRIQTLYPASLLSDWHWYSGLSQLGKPVEMIYIPEGTHILEKPWERMVSQQGNVDWFCFWLKGEEDPDPAKAEQYKRWRELRTLQEKISGQSRIIRHN